MKMRILKTCTLPLAALLAGCAGQNHTLFMTKSNAGLDFDLKPPTLEVTVSRKEGVIAPGFEGGKTPPVMASFKPKAGFGGGFSNYFLGVDQTFSGGDAAMAMAMLYDATNWVSNANGAINPFDSKLVLTKEPKYKGIFRGLAKEGEVRPFVFGTDTTLGLKAAWSGVGGQVPDTVKLGFNRKEFAWAPVMITTEPTSSKTFAVRMPSFLATVQSKSQVETKAAEGSALQYFATGAAATHLALQKEVRQAMLLRMDPGAPADALKRDQARDLAQRTAQDLADREELKSKIVGYYKALAPNQKNEFKAGFQKTFPHKIRNNIFDASALEGLTKQQLKAVFEDLKKSQQTN